MPKIPFLFYTEMQIYKEKLALITALITVSVQYKPSNLIP
jgi:hypothetical protein